MQLTQNKLEMYLSKAEAANACEEDLNLLRFLPLKEVLKHSDLPFWCYWYALDAEEFIKKYIFSAYQYARL